MTSVVVIGGGITGLTAAHTLTTEMPDLDVTLLDRESRFGGKLLTEYEDGITYEAGADAFVARDPAILNLCSDLGLRESLIAPSVFGAHIWSEGEMKKVPPDWAFGLPTNPTALLKSNLLSPVSRFRALLDLVAPGKLTGDDISIGKLIRRRYGNALLERVVDPLLAGSRAGNADDISLAAAMAPVDSVARSSASITMGMGAARRSSKLPAGPPPFLGLPAGMQQLVDTLQASLTHTTLRTRSEAARIEQTTHERYRVVLTNGEALETDAVILSTPAYAAAELLASVAPDATSLLAEIRYASSAVAVLVYGAGHNELPGYGSGFLVPTRDQRTLSACTWFSKKWPKSSTRDDRMVLRCFVGRAGRESLALDDGDLVHLIDREVRDALGVNSDLNSWKLYRWERGLPIYRVGHLELLGKIEGALQDHPGIKLAGAGYRGSGIPDCVRQGQEAAVRVLDLVSNAHG